MLQPLAMVLSWFMSKRDYTTSADTILNRIEQNVFGLNLLTRLSMYYLGYFTDLQILTLHIFPQLETFHLATDTSINDIIITGDFNFNVLNAQHSRKIEALCRQFSFYQIITEPTHFTENSSYLLDIILVNNKNHVTTSGVGDPFLDQNIRYHCPVFGIQSQTTDNPVAPRHRAAQPSRDTRKTN